MSSEQALYLLSEDENERIFTQRILPRRFRVTTPAHETLRTKDLESVESQEIAPISESEMGAIVFDLGFVRNEPKVIFLGGQSGSGKSRLAEFHRTQFSNAGGVVVVNSDALREYHPQFAHLQQTQFEKASFLVNPDTVKWQQKLVKAASESGRNLILDGTLGGDPAPIRQTMQQLRERGYSVQLSILAVPALLSRLGIYKRYEDQLKMYGIGRWVGMATHDNQYLQIPQTVTLLESEKIVDSIQLYGRSTGDVPPLHHENWLENGDWQSPPRAADALNTARHQPWSAQEQIAYRAAVEQLEEQMTTRNADQEYLQSLDNHPYTQPLIYRPAQSVDVQLFFDWANDPLTRQQSFNINPISWDKHVDWFTKKIIDPNTLMLVFDNQQGEPVGQVRLERLGPEIIIGISLDAAFRGQGLAHHMIRAAAEAFRGQFSDVNHPVHAYIRPENRASIRSFEKAGFTFSHESGKFGVPSSVYRDK
jgi:RimJ/RimL family protein N-acetyltransferase